jgi:hypothetical protein
VFQIFKRKAAPPDRGASDRKRQAPRLPPGQQQQPEDDNPDEDNEEREAPRPPRDDDERPAPPEEGRQEKDIKENKKKEEEDKPARRISPLQIFSIFTKFKDISVNFSRNDNYSNYALQRSNSDFRQYWRYQLGFTRNPGVRQIAGVTTTPSTYQRNDSYSARSGFDVGRNLNITVGFEHKETLTENTTKTGTSSDTWLRSSELGLSFLPEVDMPFFDWNVRLSGLERFKLFGKFATSLSLEHGFGGMKSKSWEGTSDRVKTEEFAFNFRPLIKANATLKNGMTMALQYSKTSGDRPTYNYDAAGDSLVFQSSATARTNELSFTMNYSKSSGFKIPLPFLNNKELRNSVEFSATFLKKSSESGLRRGSADDISANRTDSWSFNPHMTYSFSNRVSGGADFVIGKNKSKQTGETKILELGIDIKISIRGE